PARGDRYTVGMIRDEHLDVRITAEERSRWHQAARAAGLSTSEWLRKLADDATGVKLYRQPPPQKTPVKLCQRCTRLGFACCAACRREDAKAATAAGISTAPVRTDISRGPD